MGVSIVTTRNGIKIETAINLKNSCASRAKHIFYEMPLFDLISPHRNFLLVKLALGITDDSGRLVLFSLHSLDIIFNVTHKWAGTFNYKFTPDEKHIILDGKEFVLVFNLNGEVICEKKL
ncbi:Uncharacterised protein [Escherichia coli]|nr:Uncharacterised protein [Escherichia coli]CAD6099518.1 Uncharacterised protein [Escherichia coli]CAD6176013.1 Uncharacterised protein [Escherichia coli]